MNFFKTADNEINIFDFNKMRLLAADVKKKICMKFDLKDTSSPSIIKRNTEGIHIKEIFEEIWTEKMEITEYLGT